MKKVLLYGSIRIYGDGSACVVWYKTLELAKADQSKRNECDEEYIEVIETFEGSATHLKAMKQPEEDVEFE